MTTLQDERDKAARQSQLIFVREKDNQDRWKYFFEITRENWLRRSINDRLLVQGFYLGRLVTRDHRTTYDYLKSNASAGAWKRIPDTGLEVLYTPSNYRVADQAKLPTLQAFAIPAGGRVSPPLGNPAPIIQQEEEEQIEAPQSPVPQIEQLNTQETLQTPLPQVEQPDTSGVEEDHQGGGEANAEGDLSQSIHQVLSPVIQVVERDTAQATPQPREPHHTSTVPTAREKRAASNVSQLEWDPVGDQFSDDDDVITAAQQSRRSPDDLVISGTLQNLIAMAGGDGSNQPQQSFRDRVNAGFEAQDALEDDDVRTVGNLLAQIDNLDAAINRSNDYKDKGYPTILPTCRSIQTPSPSLVTPQVIDQMNEILTECGTKLTGVLHRAQLKERSSLQQQVNDYLDNFKPTLAQQAAIEIQRERRRHTISQVKDLPRLDTHLPILVGPDVSKGERLIVPNPTMKMLFSTGARKEGGGDQQRGGRGRGGNRGHAGSRSNPNPLPQGGDQQPNQGGVSHHGGPKHHGGQPTHNGFRQHHNFQGGGQFQGRPGGRGIGGRGGNYNRGFGHNNYNGGNPNYNQQGNRF
ncbi:MAG: hypothetical protein ACK518_04795 [bacterium]